MPTARAVTRRTLLATGVAALAATAGCVTGPRQAPDRDWTPTPAPEPSALPGGAFLLRDLRVFDGDGMADADSVLVEDGLITAVGRGLSAPDGVSALDAAGHTLLPGLIGAPPAWPRARTTSRCSSRMVGWDRADTNG